MNLHIMRDLGDFGTNCYIIGTDAGNAILIDAPYSSDLISREIERLGLDLRMILLTHGHCDHVDALPGLVDKYSCEVYIHEEDAQALTSSYLSVADYFSVGFTPFYGAKTLRGGDKITLDNETLTVFHTPGHTPGSVCYLHEDCIFTGDTLFQMSVGRCDFPGGDFRQEIESIRRLFAAADKNYPIYPGHGMKSDLESESLRNPYL